MDIEDTKCAPFDNLSEHSSMVNHQVPDRLFHGDLSGYTTQHKLSFNGYRTLRVLVYGKLQRMTTLTGKDFLKAWLETVKCHAFLWGNGIEHGDLSLRNLMYNPKTKCGILCDFDLTIHRGRQHHLGFDRTGTVPFMAIELLTDKYWDGELRRLYAHELESFFWILIVVCLSYQGGKPQPNKYVDKWMTSDYPACRMAKCGFIHDLRRSAVVGGEEIPAEWDLASRLLLWARSASVERNEHNDRMQRLEELKADTAPQKKTQDIIKQLTSQTNSYIANDDAPSVWKALIAKIDEFTAHSSMKFIMDVVKELALEDLFRFESGTSGV